jgi:hypothetical protein
MEKFYAKINIPLSQPTVWQVFPPMRFLMTDRIKSSIFHSLVR